MNTLSNVPGLKGTAELVESILDRFSHTNSRLKAATDKDFQDPSAGFVITAYVEYLRLLIIETAPTDQQMKKLPYSDAYSDTLPIFNIFVILKKIFAIHSVHDFCLTDLTSPTSKRTIAGIAMIDNYVSFCEMVEEEVSPKVAEIQAVMDLYVGLNDRKEKLIAQTNKRAVARLQRAKNVAELNEQIADSKASISRFTPVLQKINVEKDILEAELCKEKVKTNALSEVHDGLVQEVKNLSHLVVSGPEQIEKEHKERKEALEKLCEQIAEAKESLEESQKEVSSFEQMMEIHSRLAKHIETSSNLKKKLEVKNAKLSSKTGSFERHGMESKSLQGEHMKKTTGVSKLREQLSMERAKAESRLTAMNKNAAQLETEYFNLRAKAEADREKSSQLQGKIDEQTKRTDDLCNAKALCDGYILEQKKAMDDKCYAYLSKIHKEIDEVTAAAEILAAQAVKEAADSRL